MKKFLLSLFTLGAILGLLQFNYERPSTYIITSEVDVCDKSGFTANPICGGCLYSLNVINTEERDGRCYYTIADTNFIGFPYKVQSNSVIKAIDYLKLLSNFLLFTFGIPAIGFLLLKTIRRLRP